MSYDLFFRLRNSDSRFAIPEFRKYFEARPRYEIKELQAWYSNGDSGVYFQFQYSDEGIDSETKSGADALILPVTFNLNYFRPHPFALEAEPEVAAFVREFDLTVNDPQMSGMGDGEYTTEGFFRGWNAGNAFALGAVVSAQPAQNLPALPSSRIEAVWRWNFGCARRQAEVGNTVFVPRIFLFDYGGEARTGVAWADGIPILLPKVDTLLVSRVKLAPKRWFRSQKDVVVMAWSDLEQIVGRFRMISAELECYELFYDATPLDIAQVVRSKIPPTEMPKVVGFDRVLDRELLEQVL